MIIKVVMPIKYKLLLRGFNQPIIFTDTIYITIEEGDDKSIQDKINISEIVDNNSKKLLQLKTVDGDKFNVFETETDIYYFRIGELIGLFADKKYTKENIKIIENEIKE